MTKQGYDSQDRPARTIEEMEYEIRNWDMGRELSDTQLAERLFDLVARESRALATGE